MNAARKSLTIADLRMEMVAKIAAGAGLFVVFFSFAYSFFQIKWISDRLGVDHALLSYAFPFMIDLPSVVASALTVALHDRPFKVRLYAWSILIVFTSLSWLCNAIHAVEKSTIHEIVPGALGIVLTVLIAGIPPVGVVLGMHLWAYALRHSTGADQRAEVVAVVTRPAATVNKPEVKVKGKPGKTTAPAGSEQKPPAESAPKIPDFVEAPQVASAAWEDSVRVVFEEMVREDPNTRPTAPVVIERSGVDKHQATVRGFIKTLWAEHEAARPDDEDALAPQPVSARDEMHIADPEPAEDIEEEHARLQAAHVA